MLNRILINLGSSRYPKTRDAYTGTSHHVWHMWSILWISHPVQFDASHTSGLIWRKLQFHSNPERALRLWALDTARNKAVFTWQMSTQIRISPLHFGATTKSET